MKKSPKKPSKKSPPKKLPPKEKRVRTIEDTDCDLVGGRFVPAGSGIVVTRTLKNHYRGIWSSQFGTFEVKVKKTSCRRASKDGPYAKLISKAFADPKNKKALTELKKMWKKLYPISTKNK